MCDLNVVFKVRQYEVNKWELWAITTAINSIKDLWDESLELSFVDQSLKWIRWIFILQSFHHEIPFRAFSCFCRCSGKIFFIFVLSSICVEAGFTFATMLGNYFFFWTILIRSFLIGYLFRNRFETPRKMKMMIL